MSVNDFGLFAVGHNDSPERADIFARPAYYALPRYARLWVRDPSSLRLRHSIYGTRTVQDFSREELSHSLEIQSLV